MLEGRVGQSYRFSKGPNGRSQMFCTRSATGKAMGYLPDKVFVEYVRSS